MEGMIPTGVYLLICDSYRSLYLHTQKGGPNSHSSCSNLSNLNFRQALVVKMLIAKPFIVVEISDSDRVLLDIIK